MAFTDYINMGQVIKKNPVKVLNKKCLAENLDLSLPEWFIEDLNFSLSVKSSQENETFYEEFLIVPFLKEVWKKHPLLKVWSHWPLHYDKDFSGNPDYLISGIVKEQMYEVMNTPLLAVVQAKQQNFTAGWAQCLAAMIACQKLNDADETLEEKDIPIYGIVSTGEVWQFAKLDKDILRKHPVPASIENPEHLAGILDYIFGECEQHTRVFRE
ncbi:MAG: hypothetical protein GY862_17120 [Gammaproteobacteria bacterium]|nr:hypothetical protein [Gammaproteobacteria bacterium]